MPEYRISITEDLSTKLSNLGIREIFDITADFSPISSEKGFHTDAIIHGATIDVDRYGTEASAFTLMETAGLAEPYVPKEIYLTADHPFYYELVDLPTGVPLFMGKVVNPNQ